MEKMAITRFAAAKVNLDLRVTGRRDDGYHELDSLIAFASIGDVLTFEPADELMLVLEGPCADGLRDSDVGENLVMRAAEALGNRYRIAQGARITLTKNLPVASGLGGGSADAAASLSGLSALWASEIPDVNLPIELSQLALPLGADVPVCLAGRPARLSGIGEKLAFLDRFPEVPLVLVNPRIGLSTPRVFAALGGVCTPTAGETGLGRRAGFADTAGLIAALKCSANDLQKPAVGLLPEIADCLAELESSAGCLLSRMSGSGASCFGLFASLETAAACVQRLGRARPDWWVANGHLMASGR